jgi:uncharacterized membrane protein YphA (DoxX/SURF4 family)
MRQIIGLLRLGLGIGFVWAGIPKFTSHDLYIERFERWGIPFAGESSYLAGAVEIAAGAMLAAGILTTFAAAALVNNMVVAFLTAGLTDGGRDVWLPPTLILGLVVVVAGRGGVWQLGPAVPLVDPWLDRRIPSRRVA